VHPRSRATGALGLADAAGSTGYSHGSDPPHRAHRFVEAEFV
jgi:hypothetical protein